MELDKYKLEYYINLYKEDMMNYLPIEKKYYLLKEKEYTYEQIKEKLGSNACELKRVPKILFHGSKKTLDVIYANESSQKGAHVYATDNPIQAFFFSVFRKSSQARAKILENIDGDGNYQVHYVIDERVKDSLKEIITNETVTIHVCDGDLFYKPHGEKYINREWISKDGKDIVPIDHLILRIKDLFKYFEEKNLITYDYYCEEKDWETVIEMLSQNYAYGLETAYGNNRESFDKRYNEIIKKYFPNQYEFAIYIKEDIKKIMDEDLSIDYPLLNQEEIVDLKLKNIRKMLYKFLKEDPTTNRNIINNKELNNYINEHKNLY